MPNLTQPVLYGAAIHFFPQLASRALKRCAHNTKNVMLAMLLASGTLLSPLASARQDTLLVVVESGPNSMDIHGIGANRPAYGASWNSYDRLMTYGAKTLPDGTRMYDYTKLEPELAERWELAEDGKSVSFYLRKEATFHDGTPVTAADVKWSFDRALAVGGFPTFQMKAGSLEQPDQFEVVDEHTFRVHFLRQDKLTLPNLAVPVAAVFNSALAKKHATEQDPWAMDWLKNNTARDQKQSTSALTIGRAAQCPPSKR